MTKVCFRCGTEVTTESAQVSNGYDAACLSCDEDLIGSEIKEVHDEEVAQ
jgi:hypothetical protein